MLVVQLGRPIYISPFVAELEICKLSDGIGTRENMIFNLVVIGFQTPPWTDWRKVPAAKTKRNQ